MTYIPNFKRLEELTEEGYLRKVISPCGKLMLFNYTDKCTYEKKWNKHTLNSRGNVYEIATGKVIARAFPKFFNFAELQPVKQKTILKRTDFTVHEKCDGSLGIIYYYEGKWRVNTRGSFTSDQAKKATEMLEKYDIDKMDTGCTHMVEIIYPENKIIVNYGDEEKLVLLGQIRTNTGGEDFNLVTIGSTISMEVANKFTKTFDEMFELQQTLPKDEEGFVVRFSDGLRVKIKGMEYLKIARIKSNLSPLTLWGEMDEGLVSEEFLAKIPEELDEDVNPIVEKLQVNYDKVKLEIWNDHIKVMKTLVENLGYFQVYQDMNRLDICREIGLLFKEDSGIIKHKSAMFPLTKGLSIEKYIMNTIRPKGNQL